MNLKDLITPKELARKLGVTEQIISQWRKDGMPSVKIGKSIFIIQASFMTWIKQFETSQIDPDQTLKSLPKQVYTLLNKTSYYPDIPGLNKTETPFRSPKSYMNLYRQFGCFNPDCKSGTDLEVHHIIPKSKGGKNEYENYIILCYKCHRYFKNHSHYRERTTILWTYKFYFESKLNGESHVNFLS